ncbi:MAG: WecB/TagA/CpsF family glycosyltransferase, partial [Proteobacteria bacterium]|nr:WecB/TagA/CpsF family glycosyltransferase [Pseudomonadota bacterium]
MPSKAPFLALGSPKQEKWFAKYKDSLKYVCVCQGIGGTLDTIGGTVKRARARGLLRPLHSTPFCPIYLKTWF